MTWTCGLLKDTRKAGPVGADNLAPSASGIEEVPMALGDHLDPAIYN